MADLTPKDRLQPSLLDRLTDETPESNVESRQERVLSLRQYRNAVLRDLAWLLNTSGERLSVQDLEDYPFVAESVLNYGIPDLTGALTSAVDPTEMEQRILHAIHHYEPRILHHSIKVKLIPPSEQLGNHSLGFEIEGELWAKPLSESLFLKTELDLETGQCTVQDNTNG